MQDLAEKKAPTASECAENVFKILDGVTKALPLINREARKLQFKAVGRTTVQKWKNDGIPAKWIPIMSKLTNLPGHQINPTYFP